MSDRLSAFGDLVLAAQASGAQVKSFWLTINDYGGRVDVGYPLAIGVTLGMADIMTE